MVILIGPGVLWDGIKICVCAYHNNLGTNNRHYVSLFSDNYQYLVDEDILSTVSMEVPSQEKEITSSRSKQSSKSIQNDKSFKRKWFDQIPKWQSSHAETHKAAKLVRIRRNPQIFHSLFFFIRIQFSISIFFILMLIFQLNSTKIILFSFKII